MAVLLAVCGRVTLGSPQPAEQPEDRPRPPASNENEEVVSSGYFAGVEPQRLESIRDDTKFRREEHDAWFHLLDILNKTDQASLQRASTGRATYADLFKHSDRYRGKLVTIRGKIRRTYRVTSPKNNRNIEAFCQTWIFPDDTPTSPILIYCLQLPEDFPTDVKGPVEAEVTGFYLKRWTYQARDTLRTAPTLLAKTVRWWKPPADQKKPPADEEPAKPADEEPSEPAMITGPRDLLRRAGIDDSHFARLIDGRPVGEDENETLLQIMYQVHGFRPANVQRWARQELNPAELVKEPEAARGQLFPLQGRVILVELRQPELARQYQLEKYYRCALVLDDRHPVVIFTRTIPKSWKVGEAVDYRAGGYGVFLKFAAADPARLLPVFLAPRIAWYPNTPLGNLGMDVGLLDEVENNKELTGRDRECFFQMLAAVGRAKPGQLLREAEEELGQADEELKRIDGNGKEGFSVVSLFNEPEKRHGQLVVLSGIARRVEKVRVGDENIQTRFGIDHYYQISIFTEDCYDEDPYTKVRKPNPLVFCVRELPQGMPLTEDASYRERVRIAGFYFKKWAYRIEASPRAPRDRYGRPIRKQTAPLLIGRKPIWYERDKDKQPGSTVAGAIAGGLFVIVLLGIWLAVWRYSRADRQFREQTIAKTLAADPGVSLNEIGLDVDGRPDFSGLKQMDRRASEKETRKSDA